MMQLFEKFRSIRSGMLAVCAAGALIGFLFAVPAQAAVHFVNLGTAAPPTSRTHISVNALAQACPHFFTSARPKTLIAVRPRHQSSASIGRNTRIVAFVNGSGTLAMVF